MSGQSKLRAAGTVLVLVMSAGVPTMASGRAGAIASNLPGTVMYDKNDNVYVTDGVTTRQVTADGGTPASDGTGDSGYLVPTQSDDGSVVVAVRNQARTSSDQQTYYRGYLWVMDGFGRVIRKVNPPQFAYDGGSVCNMPANAPQGIANAQVSPDGRHIAYTVRELAEVWGAFGCYVTASYRTTVIGIDGSAPMLVDDGTGQSTAAEDLEIGSWVSNSMLLVDRGDFGSVEAYTVTLPGSSGHPWFGPTSDIDSAYYQPDVRNGVLVSEGYSASAFGDVLRVWSTGGYSSAPTYHCEVASTVDTSDAIGDPSLAPDGSLVAYQDTDANGSATAAGQGIYVMPTANSMCGTQRLLVGGANDAFWSPAGIDPPPSVVISGHPSNPTRSTVATIGFTVAHSGAMPTVTCRLDNGAATTCSSPISYSRLADGVHNVAVSASDGVHSSTDTFTWRVDTTTPVVAIKAPTALGIAATSVRYNWAGRDTGSGIASYQEQYRAARYSGGFGSWHDLGRAFNASTTSTTVAGLAPGYTYCLRVRATDRAGNGGYSAPRCFAVALDDRSLAAGRGWTRITASAYYSRTATTTTKKGAVLSRTSAATDRLGIVAKTGPGYGTVGVYVGSRLIGRVSLAAAKTHYRAVLLLPKFRLCSGTVSIKVLTSGRTVAIDGVLVSRS